MHIFKKVGTNLDKTAEEKLVFLIHFLNSWIPRKRGKCRYSAAVVACSGSSGGSLVVTPDCKPAVLGSNPAISPAYSGLPILEWAAIWDGTQL
jgi:hypothetical protein